MILIGLTGRKRSGKDTAAEVILDQDKGEKIAFADLLKRTLAENWDPKYGVDLEYDDFDGKGYDREKVLPITNQQVIEYMYNCVKQLEKHHGLTGWYNFQSININEPTIRKLLQTLGTDIVVTIDKSFWVKAVVDRLVKSIIEGDKNVFVVTDLRQKHEIDVIRGLGGKIIHLQRPNTSSDPHITEQPLPILSGDYVIRNDSTLNDFIEKVENGYATIRKSSNYS
ncbi:hypothetical protein [Providencia phage PSTCR6]|nr:hypothetical protein [Providencia phage PSTCR6]